jgi:hypothetical protein
MASETLPTSTRRHRNERLEAKQGDELSRDRGGWLDSAVVSFNGSGALALAAVDHRWTGLLDDVPNPHRGHDAHEQQVGAARCGEIDPQHGASP